MMLEIVSRLGAAAMSNQNGIIPNAVFVLINTANAGFAAKSYLSLTQNPCTLLIEVAE